MSKNKFSIEKVNPMTTYCLHAELSRQKIFRRRKSVSQRNSEHLKLNVHLVDISA